MRIHSQHNITFAHLLTVLLLAPSLQATGTRLRPVVSHHQPIVPIPCPCTANLHNCADFPTQSAAQACHDHCNAVAGRRCDIHHFDADKDGLACEGSLRLHSDKVDHTHSSRSRS